MAASLGLLGFLGVAILFIAFWLVVAIAGGFVAATQLDPAAIAAAGKPAAALPKIVEGRMNGFFKENVLLDQAFARDPKQSVGQVVAASGGTVTGFVRFRVGA